LELGGEEIIVFEYTEDSEIIDNAKPKKDLASSLIRVRHPKTIKEIQYR
jgi:hypothetical protein